MRAHHRITRTTLPDRPLAEWIGMFVGWTVTTYLLAVFAVNVTSLP